jgi:hypothetical protein
LSRQPLLLDIFKSPSWTRASPLVPRRWWTAYSSRGSAAYRNCHVSHFYHIFVSMNLPFFFWSKQIMRNHPPRFNTTFMGISVSSYIVSSNVAGFVITYDVTSRGGVTMYVYIHTYI